MVPNKQENGYFTLPTILKTVNSGTSNSKNAYSMLLKWRISVAFRYCLQVGIFVLFWDAHIQISKDSNYYILLRWHWFRQFIHASASSRCPFWVPCAPSRESQRMLATAISASSTPHFLHTSRIASLYILKCIPALLTIGIFQSCLKVIYVGIKVEQMIRALG